jgi:hypothetical protein
MKLPKRHDLIPSSWVNNNVKMLEADLDRTKLTKHGQHFNISGNEIISMKLSMIIKQCFFKKQLCPFVCNGNILSLKDSIVDYQKQKQG